MLCSPTNSEFVAIENNEIGIPPMLDIEELLVTPTMSNVSNNE